MSTQDPSGRSRVTDDHGTEAEPVVVRDRRRIDPVTGEARPSSPGQPSLDPRSRRPEHASAAEDAELAAEMEERTADLQRVSAEYANYRRRVERDRQAVVTAAKAQVVGELLAVLDDLDRAEAHGDLTGAFKLVADKLIDALTRLGMEPFGVEGEPFDPALHEAVHPASSPDVSGPTVSAVLRPGYRLGDRQLRPAMVAVTDRADGPADPAPDLGSAPAPGSGPDPFEPPPAAEPWAGR